MFIKVSGDVDTSKTPVNHNMSRKIELATDEMYHIFNRGVDSRNVFLCEKDFQRFYESMYLFNDSNFRESGEGWSGRMAEINTMKATGCDVRDRLVDIAMFNLMDNHFHMGLVQLEDGGISKFMHNLQMSYSRTFNTEHERRGSLFNRPFESRHVDNPAYADFLPVYTHLNTFDRFGVPWRNGEVTDWKTVLPLLDKHKWSSHGVALGRPQDLPVVNEQYFRDAYVSSEDYLNHLCQWSTRYADQLKKLDVLNGDDVTRNPYKH